ncbi:hypothetical protein QZH41_015538 [Actinostola sp. cb2023]|nr:hypothetical protein QZH41_015538 [Actinostola sp. cb2023]
MKDVPFLEGILASVWSQDTQRKLKAAEELSNYLSDPAKDIEFGGYEKLIDGLIAWVNSSNFRVSLSGLDILHQIVDKLEGRFKNSLLPVVPAIIERLGDSKQQVRDHAQDLIQKFMYPVSTPQHVLEQLIPAFSHKAWRVREEVLHCFIKTLQSFGASCLTLSKFVPNICKLLGDPNSQVRESAIETLVEVYRHVGEKVRIDLSKKGIPSSRLSVIYAKFDEVARSGTMDLLEPDGPSRVNGDIGSEGGKMSSSAPSRGVSAKKTPGRKTSGNKSAGSGRDTATAAGAVDETDFANCYDDCPEVRIYSNKDFNDDLAKIQTVLSDDKIDWEQRIVALRRIRSLIRAGAMEYDSFSTFIRTMEGAFKLNAKDLRSSVIRETCVTLSYLSTLLRNQFEHTAEALLPTLINLLPNSAKIMATSGDACICIIIKNTHAHRLISILVSTMTSKSSAIRRQMATKILLVLDTWETHTIKGVFWSYHDHFTDKAEIVLKSLDPTKQKQLENDRNASGGAIRASSGRAAPVTKTTKSTTSVRPRASSTQSEDGASSGRAATAPVRSIPTGSSFTRTNHTQASRVSGTRPATSSGYLSPMCNYGRSLSHIDSRAAERASRRAKVRATATRPPSPPNSRQGRSQFPTRGYVSQPTSRSHSPDRVILKERTEAFVHGTSPSKSKIPTPRFYSSYEFLLPSSPLDLYRYPQAPSSPRLRPRTSSRSSSRASSRSSSRGTSRDPSPDPLSRDSRRTGEGKGYSSTQLPVSKRANVPNPIVPRTKQQQLDDEAGLTEAAVWDSWHRSPARRKYSFGSTNSHGSDDDADSDNGSSERSLGTRGNRTLCRAEPGNEIAEIVRLCNNINSWTDRRDGVSALLVFLKSSRVMSDLELSKVKDCLTRLFFDPHNKVYSSFLDALAEFIVVHKIDIHDWLFVLLSRLLSKLGTDMLNSLQSKVVRVLDVVRDSFPYDLQFSILTRFITDQTQTPNLKVKIAVLQYLQGLISLMDPSDFTNSGGILYLQLAIETRLAVSRIISWTTEPKSAEVRKESAAVIVALFELNTPEFSMMLSVLPKSFQDGATKLLHSHLKSTSQGTEPIPSTRGSPTTRGYTTSYDETDTNATSPERPKLRLGYRSLSSNSLKGAHKDDEPTHREVASSDSPEQHSKTPIRAMQSPRSQAKFAFSPKSNHSQLHRENSAESDSYENRQTSPFKLRKANSKDHGEAHEDAPSVSSGYNSDDVNSAHGDAALAGFTSPRISRKTSGHDYDPKQYQDSQSDFHPMPELNGFATGRKKKASEEDELDRSLEGMDISDSQFGDVSLDEGTTIETLIAPLTDPSSDKMEGKRGALIDILKMIREDSTSLWNSFPKVFAALVKAVDDVQPSIRSLTIRVLKDMIRAQPFVFHEVSGTTISKILQAHKDPQKEIVRQAEEAAATVAKSLLPEDCMKVLGPIIRDSDFPVSLAAIKMLTKVRMTDQEFLYTTTIIRITIIISTTTTIIIIITTTTIIIIIITTIIIIITPTIIRITIIISTTTTIIIIIIIITTIIIIIITPTIIRITDHHHQHNHHIIITIIIITTIIIIIITPTIIRITIIIITTTTTTIHYWPTKRVDSVTIEENLSDIIPGLVRCYDHIESSVRKASVFCLVAIHNIVGEEVILPHLAELSGTKMKLLNLYIKRSQASAGGGRP